jgi:coenzyme Q-binding protein COQ10
MASFRTTRRFPLEPRQMFELVCEIEDYPKFLPFCEGITVRKRDFCDDCETVVASMRVKYKILRYLITCRAIFDCKKLSVRVECIDGPFKHFENSWRFLTIVDGCEVDCFVAYELQSSMLQVLVGALINRGAELFADAFERRGKLIFCQQGV